jgi:hypothetical protein
MSFMAYDTDESPVVDTFDLGLTNPCGEGVTFYVLALHDDATAGRHMQSGDVAFIVRPGLHPAIYSGVTEDGFEVVGDLTLKGCSGLLGGG